MEQLIGEVQRLLVYARIGSSRSCIFEIRVQKLQQLHVLFRVADHAVEQYFE